MCLLWMLVFAITWQAHAADPDIVELLQARRYAELEHRFQSVQAGFKQGTIDDEALLAAFRPFYKVRRAGLTARYDEWIEEFPKSYVAYLARGLHYKYLGWQAQDDRPIGELDDARSDEMQRTKQLAADDFKHSFELDDRPLLSYMHAMDVSSYMGMRWNVERLYAAANRAAPRNFIARRKHLVHLEARWGGSLEEMQAFVQECSQLGFTPKQMQNLHNLLKEEQAWLAVRRSDYTAAATLYRQIMADEPDDLQVAASLAWVLSTTKKCAEAIPLATRVLAEKPDDSRTISSRAFCYFHTHQEQLGIIDYHSAAELGDPWAQKRLARHYWQGNLVPKDRDRALQLLRASAVQGDTDAIREYERVTGQKLRESRKQRGLQMAIKLALGGLLVAALVGWAVRRSHRAPQPGQVCHLPSAMTNGCAAFLFFGAVAFISNVYGNRSTNLWTTLLFLGFAIAGLHGMLSYLFSRHAATVEGIAYPHRLTRRRLLPWRDVTRIDYSVLMHCFLIKGNGHRTVRISDRLLGLPEFARAVLDHAPHDTVIEGGARVLLQEIATYAVTAEELGGAAS